MTLLAATVSACLVSALACAPARAEECPAEVRLALPDYAVLPFIAGSTKLMQPPGLIVEWTYRALAGSGCRPTVSVRRRPYRRLLLEMQQGLADIGPGLAYSPARRREMMFPMLNGDIDHRLVLIEDSISLYVRGDERQVEWDGRSLRGTRSRLGVSSGVVLAQIAKGHGWAVEVADNPLIDLNKLIARRVDIIMEADALLNFSLDGGELAAVRKLQPPVLVLHRYAPVSLRFAQRYPEFTRRFWLALCQQSRSQAQALPACD
ncbi:hypothetical protein AAKU55_003718 [Oxalobacteraceae bacterium GrIS 1.11]